MAFLKKSLLATVALAAYVSAVPLAQTPRRVVHNTVTHTEWVTVNVTKTVWADKPTATAEAKVNVASVPSVSAAATTSVSVPAEPTAAAAAAAAKAPAAVPAAFAEQPKPQSAQVEPQTTATSVVPSAPAVVPPPASSTSSVNVQPKTAGATTGGACEGAGAECTGDVTHYDGGLGACGWVVNTNSDMAIALPVGMMGSQSNGNPYCGRSLSIISSTGSVVKATVGDKCMGCVGNSIDLTNALFAAVVPNGDGRVSGVKWYFD